jgi:hypothetical protein
VFFTCRAGAQRGTVSAALNYAGAMKRTCLLAVLLVAVVGVLGCGDKTSASDVEAKLTEAVKGNHDGQIDSVSCVKKSEREFVCDGDFTPQTLSQSADEFGLEGAGGNEPLDENAPSGHVSIDVVYDPDSGDIHYTITGQ